MELRDKFSMDRIDQELAHLSLENEITALREFVAKMVEHAYIAGANALSLTDERYGVFGPTGERIRLDRTNPIKETGEILVSARNFVKDKGLRK